MSRKIEELIYLMAHDEWDLNKDERDAIKAIIAERDGLSLECDRWQYAQDKLKEIVTLEELKNKQLKAENERLRNALEQYADRGNWDNRGGWDNCFFNIRDEGPDIAREALGETK
jgi:hypothetical protein